MKTKKFLCFLLIFSLLVLCACGEQGASTESQNGSNSVSTDGEQSASTESQNSSDTVSTDNETKPKYKNLMANITAENVPISEDLSLGNKAYLDFALKVFKESLSEEGKNTLISPLSIIYALGLTANGANGNTLSQMESVFGMNINNLNEYLYSYLKQKAQDSATKLSIANSIWFTDNENMLKVNEDFLQKNANYYNAAANRADFSDPQTIKDINNWVNKNTNGMIPQIIEKIDSDSVMFLINALAFEAEWTEKYTKGSVIEGEFTTATGEKETVEFMYSDVSIYLSDENTDGFMKTYKGGYAFAALLPKENMSIEEYVSTLTGEKISSILKSKQYYETLTSIPKFETEYDISMVDVFKSLGMTDSFDAKADFSKMGTADGLKIGDILHKTFISVGELGTKAGAATSVEMEAEGAPMEIKQVYLNRPFIYMLVDTTSNTPFFIGTMMNPA